MEFKRIAIADIAVPERLRAVEEEHAIAIAQSIVEHGLINPITVRSTPAAKSGKFTLVAGAHRLRATVLNDEREIDAVIVEADRDEAQLVEITENLFRNELSVIDRSVFVGSYREAWERKYGKIEAGRPGNRRNLHQLSGDEKSEVQVAPSINVHTNILDLIAKERKGFSRYLAARMGVSSDVVKRLSTIAQNLHPDVRSAIRGTAIADNQSALLRLARMEPAKQRQTAIALRATPNLSKALAAIEGPKPKIDVRLAVFDKLVSAWAQATEDTKARFMEEFGLVEAGRSAE